MKIKIYKNGKVNLIKICVMLALFTTSFDIVGMINIAGFNFRFSQFIILPVILSWFFCAIKGKIQLPTGWKSLFLFMIFQFVFMFRSPNLKNAVGYFMWLLFDIIIIFSIVYYLNKAFHFQWLIHIYMKSFVFISILGLIQFILYLLGINFFVVQTWNNRLARINGFCYEPSYYATYLIMGFILYSYFVKQKNESIFPLKVLKRDLIIITLALFLCSSRMGWLVMLLWILLIMIIEYEKLFINKLTKKKMFFLIFIVPLFFIGIIVIYYIFIRGKVDLTFFLQGMGILGTSAHSSSSRINGLIRCIKIFKESPFFGYSLGGVDPVIAQYLGIPYSTLNNGKGASIIGELLVACGLIGIVPLLNYFKTLIFKSIKYKEEYTALAWAFGFELFILCFNQNILRPYFWWHIAILSAAVSNLKIDKMKIHKNNT